MKIAILTSGILPVPAVQGGAVENLIDSYLAYNNQHHLHDITVYSILDNKARSHPAVQSDVNHYHYIDVMSPLAKVRKRLHHILNRDEFYHYSIEFYLEEALRHMQKEDYDMVLLENRPGYAVKLASVTPARIVHHLHNDVLNSSTPDALSIYQTARRILCVSQYIAGCVKSIDGIGAKCQVVSNGIDLKAFTPQDGTALRSRLGLQPDDFVLLFCGRLTPEKGIDKLIEAMNSLKQYPRIKLLIIGTSFFGNTCTDDAFITSLKHSASPLQGRIIFTGFVPYGDMPAYLAAADVAVVPSIWNDPFPTTVLEAMATGLPVITTSQGGIPEQTTPECAILLPADERIASRLAVSILDLYSDRQRCHAMGQAALERSRLFSDERYAEDFFKALAN